MKQRLLDILEIQDPGQDLENLKKQLNTIQKEMENKKINNEITVKTDELNTTTNTTTDLDKKDMKQKTNIQDFSQRLENIEKLLEGIKNKK